jgi:F0F1-type ATP synthase membrane subunit c/vacuolar-type H+-ATPase subunit K
VLLVLRIVHAALILSLLLFGGLLAMVTRPPGDPVIGADIPVRADPPAIMIPIMAALAAASLLAIYIVRRRMARDRDAVAAAPVEDSARTRARLYTGSITSWALAESIALYGLVLGIIYRGTGPFLPFAAVSLLLMIVLAPRRRDIP